MRESKRLVGFDEVARFPALGPPQGSLGHERSKGCDSLAMKGGLDQAAKPEPRPAIVGQETFPKDETEHMIVRDILVVVAVILLEDVAHPVRMKDQRER